MALTQAQIAAQMLAQLRVLDPTVSAEIGTPERKIIDTVAEAIAENQIDLTLTSGALDLSTKYGSDLDQFMALVGFGRQQGAFATGFVTFGRPTASTYDIVIPRGTQVATGDSTTASILFQSTAPVTLVAGQTSVIAPIQALVSGASGNLAAGKITQFANLGAPPLGITSVINQVPTTNGSDKESDAELKVRFKNTVFRNMAGTQDQYLALAIATKFSTKANVLGPLSRYQEYIQVPDADDASLTNLVGTILADVTQDSATLHNVTVQNGTVEVGDWIGTDVPVHITGISGPTYTVSPPYAGTTATGVGLSVYDDAPGNGSVGSYTTTPSSNPYAKFVYNDIPHFISNGQLGTDTFFYRQDTDFVFHSPPLNAGDAYRESVEGDIPSPSTTPYKPNVTFVNVYTGSDQAVQLVRPKDVLLLEYSYLSSQSRNDYTRAIFNCVDVFVNGENPTTADTTIAPPSGSGSLFTANQADRFYYQNFRRVGLPYTTPTIGHIFQGLFWQPVIDLPDQIVVGTTTFLKGFHYWAVEDISPIGGTVRSRSGIEWSGTAAGMAAGNPIGGPYTGPTIGSTGASSLTVTGYTYDRNIVDLQVALDGAKQVTTDVLAHRARPRYFKLDLTVVYKPGVAGSATNSAIFQAVQSYFANQYFGTTIQLSDLLAAVHQVSGVQNVRWSNDVIDQNDDAANTHPRVVETDVDGVPAPYGSPNTFNIDFYLGDNELPTLPTGVISEDTLPGLIIRPRAQNTFNIN